MARSVLRSIKVARVMGVGVVSVALGATAILSALPAAAIPGPILTASKTDLLVVDGNANSQADPGDTLEYTVVLQNSGTSAATGAQFSDTIDPNTTLVGGSLKTTPIARNDGPYSTVGNVQLTVPVGQSVLSNDDDPDGSGSVTPVGVGGCADSTAPFDCPGASANGGDVDLNADGSFTYDPAPGFSGTDTFTYTVEDTDGNTDPATVSISVGQVVWFVDNTAGSTGDGRYTSPFGSIANFNSLAADDPGDVIFVYQGSGAYTGGLTLLNDQQLIGNGVALSIAPNLSIAAASRPTISNVTLGSGNTVRGLDINTGSGTALSGASVGSLTVNSVTVTNTNGSGVSLSNGALAVTLDSVSASNGANGIFLSSTTGSFTVDGDGSNTSLGGNASGGTIANMSGADGTTAGTGVYLSNAQNVTLRRMTINGTNQNFGIRGLGVTNFTLQYSTVAGVNGTSTPSREGSVIFDNLFGTNAVTSSVISGSVEDNVRVENTTGTLTAFSLTNSLVQNNSTVSGNIGFRLATATPGVTMTGTVSGTTFRGNRTDAINVDASNGTVNMTISNNTIVAGTGGNNQGNIGIDVTVANNGVMDFAVAGNKVGTDGNTNQPLLNTGINVFNGTLVTTGTPAIISGTVTNNTVYNAGAGQSGFGIRLFNQGYGTMNANVSNNTVNNVGLDYGIFAEVSSNSGTANATGSSSIAMLDNTANVLSGALDAIRLQARGRSTMCASISGNASTTSGSGFFGLEIRQAAQTIGTTYQATFDLEGLTSGLQTNHATIVSYLASQNPAVTDGVDEIHSAGITGVPTGSCSSIPVVAAVPSSTLLASAPVDVGPSQPAVTTARAARPVDIGAALAALRVGAVRLADEVRSAFSVPVAYASGETVNVTLGALDPGQQVTLTFRVTIDDPVPSGTSEVCNQGALSSNEISAVLTDDPDVGGADDPTCTPLADDVPPDTSIDSKPSDPSNDSTPTFTFSGTDNVTASADLTFECDLDGGGFSACTSPYTTSLLSDGSHTFQVRAKDAAGNVDASPASYTWTIDATPPDVTIDQASGQADPTSDSPVHFTAVFSEPVTGFGDSATDVTLGGGAGATTAAVNEIAPNDGTTYDVAVSGMSTDGTVVASIPADAAIDAAGNGNTASTSTDDTVTFVFDDVPPDTSIDSKPPNPSSSTDASFGFSGTDNITPPDALTFECQLDGGGFSPCSTPKSYSGLIVGSHTFEVRATDAVGNVDPTPASYTWVISATTSLLYNGDQIVNVGNSFSAAAKLSSSASSCVSSRTISFSLDADPTGGSTVPYPLGTATTNASGQATRSVSTSGWQEGIYEITASFAGTTGCDPSSDDATLTVANPGNSATGGGWYTLPGSGRVNVGFNVRKVDTKCRTSCAYKGQLLLINNGKWRLKGTLDTYAKLSTGEGAASGSGDLFWWDATLNGGLGDWVLARSGVAFTANFYDSGGKGKKSTDTFGIRIVYSPVSPPQPNSLPNSDPQPLKGGDVKVS